MSARVNLLPPELAQRSRVVRARAFTALGVAGWAAVLALLYVFKLGAVAGVERDREQVQADVSRLQSEVAALQPYAELDAQLTARNNLLATAMQNEVSWARLLNDLALAFPPNSSLLMFDAGTAPDETAQPTTGSGIGSVAFTGYSVEEYAPGVESVLLRLNEVRGVFETYLAQAADELREETEVTTFSGRGRLNEDIYTGRYAEGLPPEPGE